MCLYSVHINDFFATDISPEVPKKITLFIKKLKLTVKGYLFIFCSKMIDS